MKKSVVTVLLALSLGAAPLTGARASHGAGLSGRTIVITGASSGFGRGVALNLARRGAKLVLASRQQSVLDELARECGGDAIAVATDVGDAEQVRKLQEAAVARFGHIDVWTTMPASVPSGVSPMCRRPTISVCWLQISTAR